MGPRCNHNLETVPRLYPTIRLWRVSYHSLRLLDQVKSLEFGCLTKPLMVGLAKTAPRDAPGVDDMRLAESILPAASIQVADTAPRQSARVRAAGYLCRLRRRRPLQGTLQVAASQADAVLPSMPERIDAGEPRHANGVARPMPRHAETRRLA
jgi:hypothetical protein